MSVSLKDDQQFKFNIPYKPTPLLHHQLPPEGYNYGVEVHIPGKEISTKGFDTYEKAKGYLTKVRELQAGGVLLYARIILKNKEFSLYPGTGRIKPVDYIKGKWYCPECNDYTDFHKQYGYEGTDAKHCQYCGLSDNDWYVKSLNGLWGGLNK